MCSKKPFSCVSCLLDPHLHLDPSGDYEPYAYLELSIPKVRLTTTEPTDITPPGDTTELSASVDDKAEFIPPAEGSVKSEKNGDGVGTQNERNESDSSVNAVNGASIINDEFAADKLRPFVHVRINGKSLCSTTTLENSSVLHHVLFTRSIDEKLVDGGAPSMTKDEGENQAPDENAVEKNNTKDNTFCSCKTPFVRKVDSGSLWCSKCTGILDCSKFTNKAFLEVFHPQSRLTIELCDYDETVGIVNDFDVLGSIDIPIHLLTPDRTESFRIYMARGGCEKKEDSDDEDNADKEEKKQVDVCLMKAGPSVSLKTTKKKDAVFEKTDRLFSSLCKIEHRSEKMAIQVNSLLSESALARPYERLTPLPVDGFSSGDFIIILSLNLTLHLEPLIHDIGALRGEQLIIRRPYNVEYLYDNHMSLNNVGIFPFTPPKSWKEICCLGTHRPAKGWKRILSNENDIDDDVLDFQKLWLDFIELKDILSPLLYETFHYTSSVFDGSRPLHLLTLIILYCVLWTFPLKTFHVLLWGVIIILLLCDEQSTTHYYNQIIGKETNSNVKPKRNSLLENKNYRKLSEPGGWQNIKHKIQKAKLDNAKGSMEGSLAKSMLDSMVPQSYIFSLISTHRMIRKCIHILKTIPHLISRYRLKLSVFLAALDALVFIYWKRQDLYNGSFSFCTTICFICGLLILIHRVKYLSLWFRLVKGTSKYFRLLYKRRYFMQEMILNRRFFEDIFNNNRFEQNLC